MNRRVITAIAACSLVTGAVTLESTPKAAAS